MARQLIQPSYYSCPITSQYTNKISPIEVFFPKQGGLEKDSKALLNQIRAVDKKRLVKKLVSISKEKMQEVDEALKISLGLKEL